MSLFSSDFRRCRGNGCRDSEPFSYLSPLQKYFVQDAILFYVMILKILLIISIILQLSAAVIAIRLTRVTKYNSAWTLITIALTAMALQRLLEFAQTIGMEFYLSDEVRVWTGVFTSLCFAVGVLYIRKILSYISMMESKRRGYEKRILNAVIQTEEKERQHFSKELHDGLGPLLSSAKMSVSALDRMNTDPKQKALIANTNLVIDEAIRSLKEVSNNMNPHVLTHFGLIRAITNFTNKMSAFSHVKVNFKTNIKEKRFDPNVEVILYRVVCEMINNTLKHASAREINLTILLKNKEITIIFADDGVGFEPEKVIEVPGGGMGISNIFSRIGSLKGEVNIDSHPGGGTRITIVASTTIDD